jgi:allene oxide cyclase
MRMNLRLAALAVAFAGGGVLLSAPALPAGQQQMVLVERVKSQQVTDLSPHGDSMGDNLTLYNPIYDKDDKVLVGHNNGVCERVVVGSTWQCTWSITLDQGSLMLQGPYYDHKDTTMAIAGGTGIYLTVTGEVKVQARNEQRTEFNLTFTLVQ